MAQVFPAFEVGLLDGLGLGEGRLRKTIGDAVRVDSDQARHSLRCWIAKPLDDPRRLNAVATAAGKLETDQFAILRVAGVPARHGPFLQLLALDRIDDAGASRERAENAEQPLGGAC